MAVDLCRIPFHLVDDVDLVGATEEHLCIIDGDQRRARKIEGGALSYHQSTGNGVAHLCEGAGGLSKDSGGGQPEEGKP
jgi:hypothetical protein